MNKKLFTEKLTALIEAYFLDNACGWRGNPANCLCAQIISLLDELQVWN